MASARQFLFGEFCLDAEQRALFRRGELVALTPKSLETLLYLAHRHGRIVEKDELMKAVWPDTFVEEVSLARNISVLRKVLSDGSDGRAFIETIPKRGYRFIAALEPETPPVSASTAVPPPPALLTPPAAFEAAQKSLTTGFHLGRHPAVIVLIGTTALVALVLWAFRSLTPDLVVTRTIKFTTFGLAAGPLATDGQRLYLGIRQGGHREIAYVSAIRGDAADTAPTIISTGLPDPRVFDISPDGSELLVGSSAGSQDDYPVWRLKTSGGSPQRLGNIRAEDAAWSPDGGRIAYVNDASLSVAGRDGSDSVKLAEFAGAPRWPRWSPDGRRIRFTLEEPTWQGLSLWEIGSSGGPPRPIHPDWSHPEDHWGEGISQGLWSRDGRYFFFLKMKFSMENTESVWVQREHGLLGWFDRPKQIYVGPLSLGSPILSKDGRTIFMTALDDTRELMKQREPGGPFVPWFGHRPVRSITFSPDGQWVAFVDYTDGTLWRCRADGSEGLRLVEFPSRVFGVAWSADGQRLTFADARGQRGGRIFVISRDGGLPVPVTEGYDESASWFPDGQSILYRHRPWGSDPADDPAGLYKRYLVTSQRTLIPGSETSVDPVLSPDGTLLAAITADLAHLKVYDFASGAWRVVADSPFVKSPAWSRDGKFLYFQSYYEGQSQPIYRVRLSGDSVEKVASSEDFRSAGVFHVYLFHALAPDGLPVVSLIRNKSDVYAFDLDTR